MRSKHVLALARMTAVSILVLMLVAFRTAPRAQAELATYASPLHAGCYQVTANRCRIHVEPFTITVGAGRKLVRFQLVAAWVGSGSQTTIYDFRPDQSNPLPISGSIVSPSLVAKDFAATCGRTYQVYLQGQDTGEGSLYNLGSSGQFSCPVGTYGQFLPVIVR